MWISVYSPSLERKQLMNSILRRNCRLKILSNGSRRFKWCLSRAARTTKFGRSKVGPRSVQGWSEVGPKSVKGRLKVGPRSDQGRSMIGPGSPPVDWRRKLYFHVWIAVPDQPRAALLNMVLVSPHGEQPVGLHSHLRPVVGWGRPS